MAVDVEKSLVPVQPLAHPVRHPAHAQQVGSAIQRQPIVSRKPLASLHFFTNRQQPRIFKYRCHSHFQKISLAQNTKNITLTYPFIVKNAASTRERSFGQTR